MERTYNFKHTLEKKERFAPGHRRCAGCGAGIAVRGVLRALKEEDRAVVGNATGCLEVSSFLYPYTAYEDSYIHSAFENAAAMPGGVEAAYNILKKKEAVGRRLDFMMQEFNRESNTLASKSINAEVTNSAIELKVLIEQMREQIQNIE